MSALEIILTVAGIFLIPSIGSIFYLGRTLGKITVNQDHMASRIIEINKAVNNAKEGELTLRQYVMDIHSVQNEFQSHFNMIEENREKIDKLFDAISRD